MTILLLIVIILGGIAFAASRKPDAFRYTRSAVIDAAPAAVFAQVNDLRKWQAWSPWAKMDPQAQTTFDGPAAGVGAKMSWEGKKTGQGNMSILDSTPDALVRFRLEFLKPMKAVNTAEFTFAAEGQNTRVTWTMFGANSFGGKVFGVFVNCQKMCEKQFDDGLANLNAVVKAA